MSLDGLPAAHLRVLLDGLPVFERYGLLLAGGYAFRAHEILHRPSQDLDFATGDQTPLPEIAAQVQVAFQRAGYGVRLAEAASPGMRAWCCSFPVPVRNWRWTSQGGTGAPVGDGSDNTRGKRAGSIARRHRGLEGARHGTTGS